MTSPRRPHRLDGLATEQISTYPLRTSAIGRRGYDRNAVHVALTELADYIGVLRTELSSVHRTLRYRESEIEQRRHGVRLPSTGYPGELIHEEQLTWHLEAQRHGDEMIAMAQIQAGLIVEDAQIHARQIVPAGSQRPHTGRPPGAHRAESLHATAKKMRELLAQVEEYIDSVDAAAADLSRDAV